MKNQGTCEICSNTYTKGGMTRHINSCITKNLVKEDGEKYFYIVVVGGSSYWLHLQVSADATLAELDGFLRDIWLECCGHLSAFTIGLINYTSNPMPEYDDLGMTVTLDRLLCEGREFSYIYDYGSSTRLDLKVMAEFEGEDIKDNIKILARNHAPEIYCSHCDQLAEVLCVQCSWDGEGWLCEDCAYDHDCGEEMILPVVNSPRVGVCGYCG